ncbi:MAG: hypothetical protein COA32_17015 [Fluviicola sp.]|nr:MAG: hypothetical protein COA32_17015 [Fluviicola sp.]
MRGALLMKDLSLNFTMSYPLKGTKRTIVFLFLIFLLLPSFSNLKAQSMRKGAVTYTGTFDNIYFNISGDIEFSRYVMRNNQAEIQVSWNWLKVNYIVMEDVQYDQLNNPMNADFGMLKSGFVGNIEIKTYIPTKVPLQSVPKDVYAGSTQNFLFQMDKSTWDGFSMEERAKFRSDWEKGPFISDVNLNSISGSIIESIIYKAKQHQKELDKEKEKEKMAEQKEKQFYDLMEQGRRAEVNENYDDAIAFYSEARTLNIDNERAEEAVTLAKDRKERLKKESEVNDESGSSESDENKENGQSGKEKEVQEEKDVKEKEKEEEKEEDSEEEEKISYETKLYYDYMEKGRAAEAQGDYTSAINYYQSAYNLVPSQQLANKLQDLRELQGASALVQTASFLSEIEVEGMGDFLGGGIGIYKAQEIPTERSLSLFFQGGGYNRVLSYTFNAGLTGHPARNIDAIIRPLVGLGIGTNYFGIYGTLGATLGGRLKRFSENSNEERLVASFNYGFQSYIKLGGDYFINFTLLRTPGPDSEASFGTIGYLPGAWEFTIGLGIQI